MPAIDQETDVQHGDPDKILANRTAELESGLDQLDKKSDAGAKETAAQLGVASPEEVGTPQETPEDKTAIQTGVTPPSYLLDASGPATEEDATARRINVTAPSDLGDIEASTGLPKAPEKPAASWQDISASPEFKALAPADQVTALHNYTNQVRDYAYSQKGVGADEQKEIDSKLNGFVMEQHDALFPTSPTGFVDTFRNEFGKHLYAAFEGAALSSAKKMEKSSWLQGVVAAGMDKLGISSPEARQENIDTLKNAADEFKKSGQDYAKTIGVNPDAPESKLGRTIEGIAEPILWGQLGLPAFVAQHRLETYGNTFNETGSADKAQRAANIASAGDLLFIGQAHGVVAGLNGVLERTGVSGIKAWAVKAAAATGGNVTVNQFLKASQAAADAPAGQRQQAFSKAFNELTPSDLGIQTLFGIAAASSAHGERSQKIVVAQKQYAADNADARQFEKANPDLPEAAQAKRELAKTDFEERTARLNDEHIEALKAIEKETKATAKASAPAPIETSSENPAGAASANGAETAEPPLKEGERIVTVQRADGSTYKAAFGDKYWEFKGQKIPAIGKAIEGEPTARTDGMLGKDETILEEQKGGENNNERSNTRQSENREPGSTRLSAAEGRQADERGTPSGRSDEGRQLEGRETSGPRDQTPNAGQRQGERPGSKLEERQQLNEKGGGSENAPAPSPLLSKWHEKFAAQQAAKASLKEAVSPTGETEQISPNGANVEEVAHNARRDLDKQIKLPKGASFIRVTDAKGRKSIITERDLKGANPLHEAGPFTKIEAGTMAKGNKFEPMKEPVALREQSPPLKAPTIEDEEALKQEGVRQGAASEALPSGIAKADRHSEVAGQETETQGERPSSVQDQQRAHERATIQAAAEALQERGSAPADLENQISKRYNVARAALRKFGLAGNDEARTRVLDKLRDDIFKNIEETGNPFKSKLKSGEIKDYSATLAAVHELGRFEESKANAARSQVPFHTGQGEGQAIEEKVAAAPTEEKAVDYGGEVARIRARAISAFSKWTGVPLDAAPKANRVQVARAAGLVADDILSARQKTFPGKEAPRINFEKFGGRGSKQVIDKLRNDPRFIQAVRKRVLRDIRQDAKALIGKDRGKVLDQTNKIWDDYNDGKITREEAVRQVGETNPASTRTELGDTGSDQSTLSAATTPHADPADNRPTPETLRYVGEHVQETLDRSGLGLRATESPELTASSWVDRGSAGRKEVFYNRQLLAEQIQELVKRRQSPGQALDWILNGHEANHIAFFREIPREVAEDIGRKLAKTDYGRKAAETYHQGQLPGLRPSLVDKMLGKGLSGAHLKDAHFQLAGEYFSMFADRLRNGRDYGDLLDGARENGFLAPLTRFINRLKTQIGALLERWKWDPSIKAGYDKIVAAEKGLKAEAQTQSTDLNNEILKLPSTREDAESQGKYLQAFAEEHGYDDVNHFAVEDPELYNEAARQFRESQPDTVPLLAPSIAGNEQEITDQTDQRAANLYSKVDDKFGVKSKEIVDAAIAAGATSREDFSKAFEAAGLTPSAAEAVGRAVNSHFRLAALEKAPKVLEQAQKGADVRTEKTNEPDGTSIQNAVVDRERAKRGLAPAMQSAAKEFGETWNEANQKIATDSGWQDRLIRELKNKPRALSDVENAGLLHRQVTLQNEFAHVSQELESAQTSKDEAKLTENVARRAELLDKLQEIYDVDKSVGTEQGRGLATRQMMAREDYSLTNMLSKRRAMNDGEALSEKQIDETKQLHQEIFDLNNKLIDHQTEVDQHQAEDVADKRVKEIAERAKKEKTPLNLDAQRQKVTAKMRDLMSKEDADPRDLNSSIRKLAEIFVRKGVTEREALVDAVHGVVEQVAPDMTRRETMDAISGYGDFKALSRNQVKATLRDLSGQMQQVGKIQDMQEGKAPLKSGVERRTPSEIEKDLIREVNQLKRTSGFEADPNNPAEIKSALQQFKERTQRRIDDYNERLANQDFAKRALPEKLALDREGLKLQANVDRAKLNFERAAKADELTRRSKPEKVLDFLVKWNRFAKLTAISTLFKLSGAVAHRITSIPVEEAVGAGLGKIPGVRTISEKATVEGGGINGTALAKGMVSFWKDGFKAVQEVKEHGESDLTARFGKQSNMPEHWTDIAGKIHQMFKEPVKQAAWTYKAEQMTERMLAAGQDVTAPEVQTRIWTEAYKWANRQIFMQDNVVVNAYKAALQALQRPNPATGKVNPVGKAFAAAGKLLVPIVKVPTNYAGEAWDYVGGALTGTTKVAWKAMRGTLDKTSPEEADIIMRQLKKGSVGAAAMALGFFQPAGSIQGGGYYTPGEKRKPGDLRAGELSVIGVKIPKYIAHTPLLEAFQFGATVRRVAEARLKGVPKGIPAGAVAAAFGLWTETPFAQTAVGLADARQDSAKFIGQFMKGAVIPAGVQNIANWSDTDTGNPLTGEVIKRAPKNLKETFETGIPGLRQNVPKSQRQ